MCSSPSTSGPFATIAGARSRQCRFVVFSGKASPAPLSSSPDAVSSPRIASCLRNIVSRSEVDMSLVSAGLLYISIMYFMPDLVVLAGDVLGRESTPGQTSEVRRVDHHRERARGEVATVDVAGDQ